MHILQYKLVLHQFLIYESMLIQKTPIFKSYLQFCEILKDQSIDYREFEFWYYRFIVRGNSNFDEGVSQELQKLQFSELPVQIVDRVLDKLGIRTHLLLRKVCKSLRQIVDQKPSLIKSINLMIEDYGSTMVIESYSNLEPEQWVQYANNTVEEGAKRALLDMKYLMNRPKLKMESLKISVKFSCHTVDEKRGETQRRLGYYRAIGVPRCILRSLAHFSILDAQFVISEVLSTVPNSPTINVEQLEIYTKHQDEILCILSYLTPGILEEIDIRSVKINKIRLGVSKILKLDQWKMAKSLKSDRFICNFSAANLANFERLKIHLPELPLEKLRDLRDVFQASPSFRYCQLDSSKKIDIENIDRFLGIDIPQDPPTPDYRYYPLEHSDERVFEISLMEKSIRIKTTRKTSLLR
ncbi:hypothetical protein B9Z55_026835 [Caenorhabditis nigoni]|uniref:F-box domain-containing protein n=1 Tax=Caenorhabditis nigoni TaxID=1611254 RepID=A0A2G5SI47_9PELO|nr:hypothetical protein B9Z55_026835 [Caenorhabditis nigoni]